MIRPVLSLGGVFVIRSVKSQAYYVALLFAVVMTCCRKCLSSAFLGIYRRRTAVEFLGISPRFSASHAVAFLCIYRRRTAVVFLGISRRRTAVAFLGIYRRHTAVAFLGISRRRTAVAFLGIYRRRTAVAFLGISRQPTLPSPPPRVRGGGLSLPHTSC